MGLGGAGGVLTRVSLLGLAPQFMVVTVINIVGSLALGVLAAGLRDRRIEFWAIPLLGTGFMGGFTTLSAVSAAVVNGPSPLTFGLALVQVVLGTAAAWSGMALVDRLRGHHR